MLAVSPGVQPASAMTELQLRGGRRSCRSPGETNVSLAPPGSGTTGSGPVSPMTAAPLSKARFQGCYA